MKKVNILLIVLLLIASTFAILYFIRPRTITSTIIEEIPAKTIITYLTAPPDTVYQIYKHTVHDTIYQKLLDLVEIYPEYEGLEESTEISPSIFASGKVFHKKFLYGSVESEVIAYAPVGVYGFDNTITIELDKEKIARRINEEIKRHKNDGFWRGAYIGAGATALLVTGILIATR